MRMPISFSREGIFYVRYNSIEYMQLSTGEFLERVQGYLGILGDVNPPLFILSTP